MARLPGPWKQLLRRHERRLARAADAVVTVSDPYAQVLGAHPRAARGRRRAQRRASSTGGEARAARPTTSGAATASIEQLGLPPERRIVLYIGQVMHGRGLRQLFEAIALVEDADLVVAGFGPDYERYQDDRRGAAARAIASTSWARSRPAEIPEWTRGADVAAMPVQPDTLNHRLNTPTKLYDAMGVGVPVVASDLPGIAPIVTRDRLRRPLRPDRPGRHRAGHPQVIDAPADERLALRLRCLRAARTRYSWQHQARELLRVYRSLGA